MLRVPFASERVRMTDPRTGIDVIQITSYPVPSSHLGYDWPSITPDGRRFVFESQRYAGRRAPWDLFRCDTDGLNLFQLTERDENTIAPDNKNAKHPTAMLSPDGTALWVLWSGDPVLYSVDVEAGRTEPLCSLERHCAAGFTFQHMRLSLVTNRLFVILRSPALRAIRVDLATMESDVLAIDGLLHGAAQEEARLIVMRNENVPEDRIPDYRSFVQTGGQVTFWSVDEDGHSNPRFICPSSFAHPVQYGKRAAIQSPGLPPDRCIWIAEEGKPPERIVEGPYFWHSGPSFDGEWIISDTNWPDEGLKLVHVPTRHYRTLVHAGATQCAPAWGHTHPALSRDGRIALWRSDRTGCGQVYLAHITEEFRQSVIAGELNRPRDKWI